MTPPPRARLWLLAAFGLTAAKLWLAQALPVHAVGGAIHDDALFLRLAEHILHGRWLGPYDQLTLAKGPAFSVWVALVFQTGLPLFLAQQLAYAGACGLLVFALRPWLAGGAAAFGSYAILLLNPMSFDGNSLARVLRQPLYATLGLVVFAALTALFHRRADPLRRQTGWAALGGLAFGCFWLTREESVWLVPGVLLLLATLWHSPTGTWITRTRRALPACGIFAAAFALPLLGISTLNQRHYGWFGTVEFRAPEFKAAYAALTRIQAGPGLPQVAVTRQMREAAYAASPAFAELRPHFEGPVGDHWSEKEKFPAAERQIYGGWFMWALRDSVAAAGHAKSARAALAYYQRVADELNAAIATGRLAATAGGGGFLPRWQQGYTARLQSELFAYVRYFFRFEGFTARSLGSDGDYAELKPFRDLTRGKMGHAPRYPDRPVPEQARLDAWKISVLDRLGQVMGGVLTVLGAAAQVVFLGLIARWLRCRDAGYALWVAAVAWLSCAAYVALNLLVHVTSFDNLNPSVFAAAYPLHCLFIVAVAAEFRRAGSARAPAAPFRN
jgi:hypothetical protein